VQRLQAGDGQAKCGGDPIYDILEGMEIIDGCQQFGTSERLGHRFAISHLDVVNVVLLEELEDVLRGLERGVAGGTVWQYSDPDRDATGNCLSVAVRVLLVPPEAGEVDGGMLYLSIVEEFNNLGTNVSPQNATLREGHEPPHE
jgi:hypothetical protein